MSAPQDSVAPPAPEPTTPSFVGTATTVVRFLKDFRDWIAALSPSGADKHDSGPVAVTLDAGFTGTCTARRVGKLVQVEFNVAGTVPTGNVGIAPNGAIPAAMRPAGNRRGAAFVGGLATGGCYATAGGAVGVRNDTGTSRTAADGSIYYLLP